MTVTVTLSLPFPCVAVAVIVTGVSVTVIVTSTNVVSAVVVGKVDGFTVTVDNVLGLAVSVSCTFVVLAVAVVKVVETRVVG